MEKQKQQEMQEMKELQEGQRQKTKEYPEIRLLRADEIECRVAVIKEKGLSLLLYKDARVDQKILDETFGIFGWQREHECIDGKLYCTVSVKNNRTGEWISKQDVGTSGMAEQEKSQASDSFKRACFNVGIGRELYSAPFIWISAIHAPIRIDKRGDKFYCSNKFYVGEIAYNEDREISRLKIINDEGAEVFSWRQERRFVKSDRDMTEHEPGDGDITGTIGMQGERDKTVKDTPPVKGQTGDSNTDGSKTRAKRLTKNEQEQLDKELARTGVGMDQITERFGIKSIKTMSPDTYSRLMGALKVTRDRQDTAA